MKEKNSLAGKLQRSLKKDGLSRRTINLFRRIIYDHYHKAQRTFPWRRTKNPYRILVSEVMLQQTQVERVLDKYSLFIRTFPNFKSLAHARLSEVLEAWQGLGYNRRAIALKKIAEIVMKDYKGRLPVKEEELLSLPGIGTYTASAICTFALNKPTLFIETNIRRVFIHFFFHDRTSIKDEEIIPLLESTLDRKNPREFYYALMDYGVRLKKEVQNPNMRSAHYQKQSRFQGSNRQIRGMILREVMKKGHIRETTLISKLKRDDLRVKENLEQLAQEGFLKRRGDTITIA